MSGIYPGMSNNSKKVLITLTSRLEQLLKELEKELGLSRSDIIRIGIVYASQHLLKE